MSRSIPPELEGGPTTGDTIGHFALGRRLGHGGGGVVYEARDIHLGRTVGLKLLHVDDADGDPLELREKLIREARYAAKVHHPNIATIFEVGIEGDSVFIAMEYVEGRNLRQLMRKSRLSPSDVIQISRQIAEAIRTAHQAGLVHRDLKPENVMITDGGKVKLLDFGLARRTPRTEASGTAAGDLTLSEGDNSMEGQVAGTPGYIAPELIAGREADHRVDIFSFGAVVYEMAAGRPAFKGKTSFELMMASARDEPPPLREFRHDIPPALETMVFRCLRKEPEYRYESFAALCSELRQHDPAFSFSDNEEDTVSDQAPARTVTDERPTSPSLAGASQPSLTSVDVPQGLLASQPTVTSGAGTPVPAARHEPAGFDDDEDTVREPPPEPPRRVEPSKVAHDDTATDLVTRVREGRSSRRLFLLGSAGAAVAVGGAYLALRKKSPPPASSVGLVDGPLRVGVPTWMGGYKVWGTTARGLMNLMNTVVLEQVFRINGRGLLFTDVLAEHAPSDDGRILRMRLRDDVWFHPHPLLEGEARTAGRVATPEDLLRSIELAVKYEFLRAPLAGRLSGDKHTDELEGVTLDGDVVEVRYSGPTPFAREFMAFVPLVPKEIERAPNLPMLDVPVGSGPYRVEGTLSRAKVRLVANPHYRVTGPGGGALPRTRVLELSDMQDALVAFTACQRGDLDLFRVDPRQRAELIAHDDNGLVTLKPELQGKGVSAAGEIGDSNFGVGYLLIPYRTDSPLNDIRVRQALALAMDREALSAPGELLPSGSLLEPRLRGAIGPDASHKQDLERSRALLADAGFPGGEGLRPLKVSGRFKIPEILEAQLARVGVRVERMTKVVGPDDSSVDIVSTGWTGPVFDSSDPGPTLVSMSVALRPRVPGLNAFEPMSLLFETDLERRTELYVETHRRILNTYRVLPYGHLDHRRASDVWLIRDGVEGVIDDATGQIVDLRLESVWRRT